MRLEQEDDAAQIQETGGSVGMSSQEYQAEEYQPQATFDTQWVSAATQYGRFSR